MRTTKREVEDTSLRISEAEASKKGEEQQLLILERLIEDETSQLDAELIRFATLETKYKAAVAQLEMEQSSWKTLESDRQAYQQRQLDIVASIETSKATLRNLEGRKSESVAQVETLEAEIKEVQSNLAVAKCEHESLETQFNGLSEKRKSLLDEERSATERLREARKSLNRMSSDVQKAQGRLELLAQWAEQHEGYLEGTKNILNGKGTWREAVKGAVGDLFTVNNRFTVAIEIALGGSVNHVVTTTAKAASEGVTFLKSIQGGRVTFLPMESVKGRPYDTPALSEDGVIGTAVDCIEFDAVYSHIFQYLLGRTLVVETMERAIELQKKYNQQLRIVTLTGEQFQPGGSLTGGATKKKRSSLLSRREEALRLESELASVEERTTQLEQQIKNEENRIERAQQERSVLDEQYQHTNLLYSASQTKIQNIENQLERKNRVLNEERERIVQIDIELGQTKHVLSQSESELAALHNSPEQQGDQSAIMERLSTLQKAQQEAYEAFTASRLLCERLEATLEERKLQQEQRKQSLETIVARLAPLMALLQSSQERLNVTIPDQIRVAKESLDAIRKEVEKLRVLRDEAYQSTSGAREEIESILSEQDRLNQRYKVVQNRLVEAEGKLTRYRMDCERSIEDLNKLGYSLEDAQHIHIEGSVNDWKMEQARLMAEIAELGSVNPNAVEEYEETKTRYDFLSNQLADLDIAKEQLQAVIAEMDKAMSTQLYDVLDVVGQRFQEVFSQLFGGGTAQIVLTDPDNILTGGIDFYIQPPGKKRQQLTLLSGGERALTVIALLFSFLDYRPAPFCVLDEVDAALDEANVERFSSYLNRVNKETQFIVVSHRKKTMEAAEVLQGVTMVERGVSRLLTVSFEDVKEDLA